MVKGAFLHGIAYVTIHNDQMWKKHELNESFHPGYLPAAAEQVRTSKDELFLLSSCKRSLQKENVSDHGITLLEHRQATTKHQNHLSWEREAAVACMREGLLHYTLLKQTPYQAVHNRCERDYVLVWCRVSKRCEEQCDE